MRSSDVDRIIAAYERNIEVLEAEVKWLRSYIKPEPLPADPLVLESDSPNLHPPTGPWEFPKDPPLAPQTFEAEDADVIRAALENGEIDTTEAEEMLRAIGAKTTEIEFAS